MNKLSQAHRAEVLKRMLMKQSPAETNMAEQAPGMPLSLPPTGINPIEMNQSIGMPGVAPGPIGNSPNIPMPLPGGQPGMPMPPMAGMPMGDPQSGPVIPQLPIERNVPESSEEFDLGNKLLKERGLLPKGEHGEKTTLTDINDIIKNEADASMAWKIMGGYDSSMGHLWQTLSEKTKLYNNNGRDYFVSCYNKFLQKPGVFQKTNPKEAMLVSNIIKIMEQQ